MGLRDMGAVARECRGDLAGRGGAGMRAASAEGLLNMPAPQSSIGPFLF